MMTNHDHLTFASEEGETLVREQSDSWKILLVDDEPAVHDVTLLALNDFEFNGRKADFLHAYTAEEAKQILRQQQDIAVALIDVVMESDDSGIRLVEWIRNELNNRFIRLILRTGQPGQAPERQVVLDLDVNDYKEKSELTFAKLYTLMVTSIRSYISLKALEKSRQGLIRMVNSSRGLATHGSIEMFVEGVLMQLQAVFKVDETAFYCDAEEGSADNPYIFQDFLVISGIGEFSGTQRLTMKTIEGSVLEQGIRQTLAAGSTQFIGDSCYLYFRSASQNQCVVFINRLNQPLDETEKGLLDVFCNNINYAFDNLALNREIDSNQREILYTLSTIAEFRSREVGRHIARVSRFAEYLGHLHGLESSETELLLHAMPMHDVGKIAIKDDILHKPGSLNDDEMEAMRRHAQLGYEMLKDSSRELFKAAAIIAQQHHERWDGSGYPQRLKGEEIHIYGRIAAVVDVFDALLHQRVYKAAWSIDEVTGYFRDQAGKHFDPVLANLLLQNLDQFLQIASEYTDD